MNDRKYLNTENITEKTENWLKMVERANRTDITPDMNNSALIVIDMQNYFFYEKYRGYCPASMFILPNIKKLIARYREIDRPVIFTKHCHKTDGSDLGVLKLWWDGMIDEGTFESEIYKEITPTERDLIVSKNRFSAFYNTNLNSYLKSKNISQLVFCGLMTNVCVESSVRDAFFRDFVPFIPADATASKREIYHISSLINISYCCGVITKTDSLVK